MIVKNPLAEALEVQIRGHQYRVEAGEKITVPKAHAEEWKARIHGFIILIEDGKDEEEVEAEPVVLQSREEAIAELGEEKVLEIEASAIEGDPMEAPSVVEAPKAPAKKGGKKA